MNVPTLSSFGDNDVRVNGSNLKKSSAFYVTSEYGEEIHVSFVDEDSLMLQTPRYALDSKIFTELSALSIQSGIELVYHHDFTISGFVQPKRNIDVLPLFVITGI